MDQAIRQELKIRIEQAVRDGYVHFDAAGERLDSIDSILDIMLSYGRVTVRRPARFMLSKIDEQIDFSVPPSQLMLCFDNCLWLPKDIRA